MQRPGHTAYWPKGARNKKNYHCITGPAGFSKILRRVHSMGALLFTSLHSHLILLQHLSVHLPFARRPIHILSAVPKYWTEEGGVL